MGILAGAVVVVSKWHPKLDQGDLKSDSRNLQRVAARQVTILWIGVNWVVGNAKQA